jgi:hypothetical protein
MKTIKLKKVIQVMLFYALIIMTAIITKITITDIKYLYGTEKDTTNILTCFCDMIY